MKSKLLIGALLIAAAPIAHATTIYEVTSEKALSCPSGAPAPFEIVFDNPVLAESNGCVFLPRGTRMTGYAKGGPHSIKTSPITKNPRDAWKIWLTSVDDLAIATGRDGKPMQDDCNPHGGGLIERYVTDERGAVYLKRTLVSFECVNGRDVPRYRNLN